MDPTYLEFQWLAFWIYLPDLASFIKDNILDSDGIVADISSFEIVIKRETTENDITAIQRYLDSLTEDGELAKQNL